MTSSKLADVEPPPQDPGEARAAPTVRLRAARAAYETARDDVVRQLLLVRVLTAGGSGAGGKRGCRPAVV